MVKRINKTEIEKQKKLINFFRKIQIIAWAIAIGVSLGFLSAIIDAPVYLAITFTIKFFCGVAIIYGVLRLTELFMFLFESMFKK